LFGDDLAKQIRNAKETSRIGQTVAAYTKHGHSRSHRCQNPYQSGRHDKSNKGGSRQSFLGERIPLDGAEKTVQQPQERDREAIMASLEQLKLAVSDFPPFVESCLRNYLRCCCNTFTAGCIVHSLPAWRTITSDNEILSTVMGLKIDVDTKPRQQFLPNCRRSATEATIIDAEIKKLSSKRVIEPTRHCPNDFPTYS